MDSDPAAATQRLLARPEEPATELPSPVLVLYLLIVLKIVSDNQPRPTTSPLRSTDLLLSASRDNPELVPVMALDDDIRFSALHEPFDLEVPDQVLVLRELVRDILEMLNRLLFARPDDDNVALYPKAHASEDKIVGERGGLRMRARSSSGACRMRAAVALPGISMELRCRLWVIIARGEVSARECLDPLRRQDYPNLFLNLRALW